MEAAQTGRPVSGCSLRLRDGAYFLGVAAQIAFEFLDDPLTA